MEDRRTEVKFEMPVVKMFSKKHMRKKKHGIELFFRLLMDNFRTFLFPGNDLFSPSGSSRFYPVGSFHNYSAVPGCIRSILVFHNADIISLMDFLKMPDHDRTSGIDLFSTSKPAENQITSAWLRN